MIAALLLQAAIPGFAGIAPGADERLAMPHVVDAIRAPDAAARARSLDAALALLPQPTRFRGAFQCMRGSMLMHADPKANRAAALAATDECLRLNPDLPLAQRFAADAAFARDDYPAGATLLAKAVTRDPALARGLTGDGLDSIFRQLGYARGQAERRALAVALAGTEVAQRDPVRLSGWMRESVAERVDRGDLTGAAALLPYMVDPGDALPMLVDRRYAALWPRLEDWSGGDLSVQRAAIARAVRGAYEADPTLARARDAAGVLAQTGDQAEGLALLERAVTAFGAPRDDYDYARAVVRLAALRAKAGEPAARVLAPMEAALANGVTGPMLVNVVPNLALDQALLGQPEAALATLDRYAITPGGVETRAAYGYFVAIRGCALAELRRGAEAQGTLRAVLRDYPTNDGAVDLTTACVGSDAAVLARWIARVDDPDTRAGALMAMTAARAGVAADPLSPAFARLHAIAARAEVDERMARYARALPAGYLPVLRMRGGE